jgi:Icc-related predicted phosphoesterase
LIGEFARSTLEVPVPPADVCVMAGDLSENIDASMRWLGRNIRSAMPVIFVLGNHDFLGSSLTEAPAAAQKFAHANGIVLLNNAVITLGRTRFIGSTLWTDFEINADLNLKTERDVLAAWLTGKLPTSRALKLTGKSLRALKKQSSDLWAPMKFVEPTLSETEYLQNARARAFAKLKRSMPEYNEVYVDAVRSERLPRLMRPADAYKLHVVSRKYIESELVRHFEGQTVVVSHHAPHPRSISDQFKSHPLNPAFVSDLSRMIDRYAPDMWIHGHTHSSFDYFVGPTRIICNPHGGPHPNPQFEWQKVIAI